VRFEKELNSSQPHISPLWGNTSISSKFSPLSPNSFYRVFFRLKNQLHQFHQNFPQSPNFIVSPSSKKISNENPIIHFFNSFHLNARTLEPSHHHCKENNDAHIDKSL